MIKAVFICDAKFTNCMESTEDPNGWWVFDNNHVCCPNCYNTLKAQKDFLNALAEMAKEGNK